LPQYLGSLALGSPSDYRIEGVTPEDITNMYPAAKAAYDEVETHVPVYLELVESPHSTLKTKLTAIALIAVTPQQPKFCFISLFVSSFLESGLKQCPCY